jgi:tetratricopeptide (TPR) repeat protein
VRAYEMVLARSPSAAVYGALGEIYGKELGDLAKARAYLEDGLRVAPEDVSILTKLGIVYGMTGETERALELFDRAISRDPGNATLYLDKGMALRQMGNVAEGDRFVDKALQIDPTLAGER